MARNSSTQPCPALPRPDPLQNGSFFSTIAEFSPNMIFVWTATRIAYANRKCSEIMGYSQTELCTPGFDFRCLIAPASRPLVQENLRRHLRGEDVPAYEYEITTRDGTTLNAIHTTKLIDYGGERAILGIVTDITELRRAETELRQSEARQRAVLESIDEVVCQVDASPENVSQARVSFMIGNAEAIFGHRPEEFVSDAGLWLSLLHADDVSSVLAQTRLVFDGRPVTRLYRVRAGGDAGERWVEDRLVPKRDDGGRVVGFYGVVRDVTERRRKDEQIRKLHRAVEQSPVGVIVADRGGRIEYVNTCFAEVTGFAQDEVLGRSVRLLTSDLQSPEFYGQLWRTIQSGEEWTGHLQHRRRDGSSFWVRAVIAPVTDEGGEITHVVIFAQDVTEFRRQEEALRQSQAQLIQAQKSEAVGRLAGGIAHDFNNLMSVVSGYSGLLLHELPAGDPSRTRIEQIAQAAERAAGLTRQLLAYSRKQVLQPAVVDLNALLDEQSAMLERLIGEDVELELHGAPDLGRVLADPGQLQQVVMNLAVNARDAMPDGGRLSITTSNEDLAEEDPLRPEGAPAGPYVRLVVSDTGHGMSEEVRNHLFEPFFTTKDPGKGTGLGLSTIYGIVTQSGGYIRIDSTVGRGTSALILLPRISAAPETPAADEARAVGPVRGAARLVLLVEDNAALRALTEEVLEAAGFRVIAASNGEQGAALARERSDETIDLLLTDVVLPKRGGPELAAEVRAAHPETRVIFTSGYTSDVLGIDGALHAGGAFLQKPVSPGQLLAKIAEVLDEPGPRPC